MTLERLDLDDLTWSDLMDQVRAAIPAESDRHWTLHAPVDPGITLLELYAARLEEQLYWLDQVPDDLVRALLRLLGTDPPRPAVPAATVLTFHGPGVVVAAGTAVRSPGLEPEILLTTDHDLTVLDGVELRVVVGGVDRTSELGGAGAPTATVAPFGATDSPSRAGIDLLASSGRPEHAELVLRLAGPGPVADGAPLAIALLLETPEELEPGWAVDAPDDVPPPAELRWAYRDPDGRLIDFDHDRVHDGTGGLRRSGLVRFPNPTDAWVPTDSGPVELVIDVSTEAATFSSPPRLIGAWPNAVVARHHRWIDTAARPDVAEDVADQIGRWLPLPDLELIVPRAAGQLIGGADGVRLRLVEGDGRSHPWHPVDDFAFGGPGDRVFVVDRLRGGLRFGDGYGARIPVPGIGAGSESAAGVALAYRLGGGTSGNLGSNLPWAVIDETPGPAGQPDPIDAVNVVPLTGGADPETVAAARQRARGELARRHRAVTGDDYATLAFDTEILGVAVARVHVGPGRHPAFPCHRIPGAVTVVVVPDVPIDPATARPVVEAPRPDPGLIAAVATRLEAARLLATEVFVEGPTYRPIEVVVTLDGGVADLGAARAAVADALADHLDPLVGGGGTGWPFGATVRPSGLLGVVQRALGPAATVAGVAVGVDGGEPGGDCDDITLEPHELVQLIAATVVPGPHLGSPGGLR